MTPLPIDEHLPRLTDALTRGKDVVLVAEPGAGKTTRVPPAILSAGLLANGHLVMLQPRRVAARLAADRIASENGWRLSEQVGYQVRHERVLQKSTPIRILTEGVLARQVVGDPALEGIAVVVLDEFHERSLDADLTLAMLKEARALRDDLRIVVMSATLDADAVANFLGGAETLRVPGASFLSTSATRATTRGRSMSGSPRCCRRFSAPTRATCSSSCRASARSTGRSIP